jgi:hypothetical protein
MTAIALISAGMASPYWRIELMPMANPTSGEMYLLPISMKPPMLGEYTVLTLQRRPWITRRKRSHFTEAVHHHADEAADDGVSEEEANRSTILRRG